MDHLFRTRCGGFGRDASKAGNDTRTGKFHSPCCSRTNVGAYSNDEFGVCVYATSGLSGLDALVHQHTACFVQLSLCCSLCDRCLEFLQRTHILGGAISCFVLWFTVRDLTGEGKYQSE